MATSRWLLVWSGPSSSGSPFKTSPWRKWPPRKVCSFGANAKLHLTRTSMSRTSISGQSMSAILWIYFTNTKKNKAHWTRCSNFWRCGKQWFKKRWDGKLLLLQTCSKSYPNIFEDIRKCLDLKVLLCNVLHLGIHVLDFKVVQVMEKWGCCWGKIQ